MGYIIPTLALECIPGDKFKIGCKSLTRFMPLATPVMQHMDLKMEYFFVPNRLVWDGWEDFITPGRTTTPPAFPFWRVNTLDPTTYTKLLNYMGVPDPTIHPAATPKNEDISALALAAYQMVCNEYYRNDQIDAEINYKLIDGDNVSNPDLVVMRKRGWMKDYYTSALPTAQAGPAVDIPLGDVKLDPDSQGTNAFWRLAGNHALSPAGDIQSNASGVVEVVNGVPPLPDVVYDPNGTLEVDPTTITSLRRAFKLQEWLERAMRGGKRYVESIYSFFGVKSPDSRLQRPEFITGVKTPIQISEVLNTSATAGEPQGNMAGHGIAVLSKNKYGSYFCQEHGYIIGVCSLVPTPSYFQGIPKHFLKITDPYQYYWEQFAHIGEQEITKNEIKAYVGAEVTELFGYTPRYAEYKQLPNRIAGQLQTTLRPWTLAREFEDLPTLSEEFVHIDPATTDQIFAVTDPDEDKLIFDVYHQIMASRQMPIFGNPTM